VPTETVNRTALEASLPERTVAAPGFEELARLRDQVGRKVVVLDDDPTGTQTVHGVTVMTRWDPGNLADALLRPDPALFLLTNSRSMDAGAAAALNRRIAAELQAACEQSRVEIVLVSRSDSTLRGHFPLETDVLSETLGPFDATVIAPCFFAGGRVTVEDIHYAADGDRFEPVGRTPFAADPSFGYDSSNLRDWIEEKTDGRVRRDQVVSLSLALLRQGDDASVDERIAAAPPGGVIAVNAYEPADLHRAVGALMRREAAGSRYLYRTAASLVSAHAAIERRPPLNSNELGGETGCGRLIVVGSYVRRTTAQLAELQREPGLTLVELDVEAVVGDDRRAAGREVDRAAAQVNRAMAADGTVVLYTQRGLVQVAGRDALTTGARVTDAVVHAVKSLDVRPRWILAKGGIIPIPPDSRAPLGVIPI